MPSAPGKGKKIPEWQLFDRIDELEDITLKLWEEADATGPTLKKTSSVARDSLIVARNAILLNFIETVVRLSDSNRARKKKDMWLEILKRAGLSEETLNWLRKTMTRVCEVVEED